MGKKKVKITIIQDTREQKPLDFSPYLEEVEVEKGTVWPGDYTIKGFEKSIAIERKSVSDLIATLKGGYVGKDSIRRYESRFDLELEEFERHFDRVFVIIEPDDAVTIRRFGGDVCDSSEQIAQHWYRSALRPENVFAFIRALVVDYGCHVYMASSREDAAHEIVEISKRYVKARRHVIHRGKIEKETDNKADHDPW